VTVSLESDPKYEFADCTFVSEWLYLSLESSRGTRIKLKLDFHDEPDKPKVITVEGGPPGKIPSTLIDLRRRNKYSKKVPGGGYDFEP